MSTSIRTASDTFVPNSPAILDGLPLLYEDEDEGDMGEANVHEITTSILRFGLEAHLASQPQYQVFSNLNLYYHPKDLRAYVSPDLMVVKPFRPLPVDISSYRIGEQGPGPELTVEILSDRSTQQRDKTDKVDLYAKLGVAEYVLVDVTGRFMPERLWMKRLLANATWNDEQDPDGGISSLLGFRLAIDSDGRLHVFNKATGHPYVRPDEAERRVLAETDARRAAEAELERLRNLLKERNDRK